MNIERQIKILQLLIGLNGAILTGGVIWVKAETKADVSEFKLQLLTEQIETNRREEARRDSLVSESIKKIENHFSGITRDEFMEIMKSREEFFKDYAKTLDTNAVRAILNRYSKIWFVGPNGGNFHWYVVPDIDSLVMIKSVPFNPDKPH